MRTSNLITTVAVAMLTAVGGCSQSEPAPVGDPSLKIALSEVPSDVHCLVITVKGPTRTVTRAIPANPGEGLTETLDGLPVGSVLIQADAFDLACGQVQSDSVPTWVSEPATATLTSGQTTPVKLTMMPNGLIQVDVDWQQAPIDGSSVDAGTGDTADDGMLVVDAGEVESDAASTASDVQPDSAEPAAAKILSLGMPGKVLLMGTVVTPAETFDGQVLIEGDTITCAAPGTTCSGMPGALSATVIDTAGVIAPGLVDTHNHVLFDVFDGDDWTPKMTYQNHNQWVNEPGYQAMLDVKQCLSNDSQGKPVWCANTPYGTTAGSLRCELDKYGELKGLVGGTTSLVGLPGTSASCFGSLARSVDSPQNGLGTDKIQTSAIFPPSKSSADGVCANFASDKTDAYLIHCGEGIDMTSLNEFATLGTVTTTDGCLYAPQTTITHGVAFTSNEFVTMAQAGMKLTWSPSSNISLHGQTANIPVALDAGVLVALAPDWSTGGPGSRNLLEEMHFADAWDNSHWNDRLSAKALVEMSTINGAKVLALDGRLGQIQTGYLADIAVFAGDRSNPYNAILAARSENVTLVMVGGTILYGDLALKDAAPAQPGCETMDICGAQKFLCVATTTTTSKLNQTYAQITTALSQAMLDVDAQTPGDGFNFAPLTPLVKCGQ